MSRLLSATTNINRLKFNRGDISLARLPTARRSIGVVLCSGVYEMFRSRCHSRVEKFNRFLVSLPIFFEYLSPNIRLSIARSSEIACFPVDGDDVDVSIELLNEKVLNFYNLCCPIKTKVI